MDRGDDSCDDSATRVTLQTDGAASTPNAEGESGVSKLRPFFGFYGGKWRDAVRLYPAPTHDTIVEPFAGSAGYSVRYASRKVILCELDPVLAAVWEYLVKVKESEIRSIPTLRMDCTVDSLKVCKEAKWLVGLWLNRGADGPRRRPSKWMRSRIRPGSFWGSRVRNTIASQLSSIRDWKIFNCSYDECPYSGPATWFIDPPYESAGKHYRFGSKLLDYSKLADWCRARDGQVIVCENKGASWLTFRKVASVKTTRRDRLSKEVVWTSEDAVTRDALRTGT